MAKSQKWREAMAELHRQQRPKYTKARKVVAARMGLANGKEYLGFVSPLGEVFAPVENLSAFCREWGLTQSAMSRLAQGKLQQHKGWKRWLPDLNEKTAEEGPLDAANAGG